MPQTVASPVTETLASQFAFAHGAALRNLDGIADAEAEQFPMPGGNSMNWIAGHLVAVRQRFLSAFGPAAFLSPEAAGYYARGAKPSGKPPLSLTELRAAMQQSQDALQTFIAGAGEETLGNPAPFSPANDPKETVQSLLTKFVIHDSYHSGQLGISRRLLGKEGAIS